MRYSQTAQKFSDGHSLVVVFKNLARDCHMIIRALSLICITPRLPSSRRLHVMQTFR
jgi:hypothetical protein